jgi:hypothetical protein
MRDLMVIKAAGPKSDLVLLTEQQKKQALQLAEKFDIAGLVYNITTLEKLRWSLKNSDTARPLLEAAIIRLTMSEHFLNIDQLLSQSPGSADPPKGEVSLKADKKKVTPDRPPAAAQVVPQGQSTPAAGLDSIKSVWRDILTAVGKGTAGLLAVAAPVQFENGTLTIDFPASAAFQKKACDDRIEQIESVLREKCGSNLRLKLQIAQGENQPADQPPPQKTKSQKQNEILSDPAVKTVIMGLDATITNIEDD